jgi:hypothetical protein
MNINLFIVFGMFIWMKLRPCLTDDQSRNIHVLEKKLHVGLKWIRTQVGRQRSLRIWLKNSFFIPLRCGNEATSGSPEGLHIIIGVESRFLNGAPLYISGIHSPSSLSATRSHAHTRGKKQRAHRRAARDIPMHGASDCDWLGGNPCSARAWNQLDTLAPVHK